MGDRFKALALAVIAPLMLMGCVLVPGKFASTLHIAADRSFVFTYRGEVIAVDLADEMSKAMADDEAEPTDTDGVSMQEIAHRQEGEDEDESSDAKFRAIAEALSKEPGYRSVAYRGEGVFDVDFETRGALTHPFVYPFNTDAEVLFPFLAIELRGRNQVRVKAPAFGENDASGAIGKPDKSIQRRDGTFTLTTDAEIVSQNNEDGVTTEGANRKIVWKATPLSKDAPMAVLKLRPLS